MEKIRVDIQWCEKNFGATLSDNVPGAVVFTADSIEQLQKEAQSTLQFHVEGLLEDGDDVPQWLADGDYEFEWHYVDTATLLRACEPYASIAAISRASGIDQHQLVHYANRQRKPRPFQQQRIVEGIHKIGQQLIAIA